MKFSHDYYVYILLCSDGTYYTGMTNSMDRRLREHTQSVDPTCYTFTRRPLELKYFEHFKYVNDAARREKQIKRWSHAKKEALINGDVEALSRLAKGKRP